LITLTPGSAANENQTPKSEGIKEGPPGCQKIIINCQYDKPNATITVCDLQFFLIFGFFSNF
jgi:hypothetical protein